MSIIPFKRGGRAAAPAVATAPITVPATANATSATAALSTYGITTTSPTTISISGAAVTTTPYVMGNQVTSWSYADTNVPLKTSERLLYERKFLGAEGLLCCEMFVERRDTKGWAEAAPTIRLDGELVFSDGDNSVVLLFDVDDVMDSVALKAQLARVRQLRRMLQRFEKSIIAAVAAAKMGVPIQQAA